MKRIIDGVTYDTQTATEVYSAMSPNAPYDLTYWGLFQTRHGAFFQVVCHHDDSHTFTPLSDAQAQKLLERDANHLVEQFFGPLPEYGSAEKRMTLRMPIGLARRVEAAAKASSLDVNKYVQRCLEKAVKLDGQPPTVI